MGGGWDSREVACAEEIASALARLAMTLTEGYA